MAVLTSCLSQRCKSFCMVKNGYQSHKYGCFNFHIFELQIDYMLAVD